MNRSRLALACAMYLVFAVCTVFAVLGVIAPPSAPAAVQPSQPLTPRLSPHVLFVIVDGLRYDIATDPKRMPHFSEAMARETSSEIWAGRISMTTSAIMAIGTGQRGRLEQVVRNVHPGPPPYNSWLGNAKAVGLRIAVVGDPAWVECFGPHLSWSRQDPSGVAIDVDFNPQTFRNTREALARTPDLLIAHFVTPDHQGHAYGVLSSRYEAHIRAFDRDLERLLAEVGPEWTVIVTSDHGATDTGKHGSDVAVQRKSPIYAYGPGIRTRMKSSQPLDQLELAALLPSLLGVAAPAHRTGGVAADWLDLPEAQRADVACENAQQVLSYARSVASMSALELAQRFAAGCRAAELPSRRMELAKQSVQESDRAVDGSAGLLSPDAMPWLAAVLVTGLLASLLLLPAGARRGVYAVVVVLASTVALVMEVERLPGVWPDRVRAVFFVLCNLGLLLLLLRPARFAAAAERLMPYAPALAPGLLVLSYSANTRPESYVALSVCALVYVAKGSIADGGATRTRWSTRAMLPLGLGLVALLPALLHENESFSRLMTNERVRPFAYAGLFAAWLVWQRGLSRARLVRAFGLAFFAVTCFALRSHVGPTLGRLGWAVSGLWFVSLCVRGKHHAALSVGAAAYVWLARDFEVLPLLAALTVASVVGERIAEGTSNAAESRPNAADLVVQTMFVFALGYVLRIGIQDGLEFGGMDWHAGAFADPQVSARLVACALVYKYALASMLVVVALLARLPHVYRGPLLIGVVLCFTARALALSAMLFVAGNSYWTALRVLGDLPTALAMGLGAVLALATFAFRNAPAGGTDGEPRQVVVAR